MHRLRIIRIGACSLGPVVFDDGSQDHKHVICIANYDRLKHPCYISCKTTSKNLDRLWPGEFHMTDLFGKGQTKVQPYNVLRLQQNHLNSHKWVGMLDNSEMPKFEHGLRIGVKAGKFTPDEVLEIADSWEPFFGVS